MFSEASFVIAPNWKPPKGQSTGELIHSGKHREWNNTRQ